MKKTVEMIMGLNYNDEKVKDNLARLFMAKFMEEALFSGKFFWTMSDPKEVQRLYGYQEIGWFNDKTEQFLEEHSDGLAILQERVVWGSKTENFEKVRFSIIYPKTNHQLFCVEMKLKAEFSHEKNFYLKVGMIPVWNEDYSKIIDYVDKLAADFHDWQLERETRRVLKLLQSSGFAYIPKW